MYLANQYLLDITCIENTHKSILYQNMKLHDDKKEEIMI